MNYQTNHLSFSQQMQMSATTILVKTKENVSISSVDTPVIVQRGGLGRTVT